MAAVALTPEPDHPPRRRGWAALRARRRTVGPAPVAVLVGVVGIAAGAVLPDHRLFALGQVAAWLAAAAGLTLLIGLSGQLSLGHGAFMATGAYATALTLNALYAAGFTAAAASGASGRFAAAAEPTAALWTLPVALLAGVGASLGVGALLALAAARTRGPYLAGVTLAFGLIVAPVTALVDGLGGEQGLRVPVPRVPAALAAVGDARFRVWVALAATVLVLAGLAAVASGRLGRELRAARDDEVAAALSGIPVARRRVVAFLLSAGAAGLGGGLYTYLTGTVLPGYFGFSTSLFLLVAVVVGGPGRLAGAAAGTLFVVAAPILTGEVMSAVDADPALTARLAGNLPLALLGLALIGVTLAKALTSSRRSGRDVPE